MAAKQTLKAQAWTLFDRIIANATPQGVHSNPWQKSDDGSIRFHPDYAVLSKLLGVPLLIRAESQTGVPALALDVWTAYEFRRAGFDPDAVWPRATAPRVFPSPLVNLIHDKRLPQSVREDLRRRLTAGPVPGGTVSADAKILGKNYVKQVDVGMSEWATGPQLLVSTKRMDSSFGKNAPNRIEESYGDAKNLRLRHPLAALGFLFGLRSTIFDEQAETADWLVDMLEKLGEEDDAYHAVALVVIEYNTDPSQPPSDDPREGVDPLSEAGLTAESPSTGAPAQAADDEIDAALAQLPDVRVRIDRASERLQPSRFLAEMTRRVLNATPVNFHRDARARMQLARAGQVSQQIGVTEASEKR